jgi:hypothetical protein
MVGGALLRASYQSGYAAVYPIAADGTIGAAAVDKQETAVGAHAIATDLSNRFAFVLHTENDWSPMGQRVIDACSADRPEPTAPGPPLGLP